MKLIACMNHCNFDFYAYFCFTVISCRITVILIFMHIFVSNHSLLLSYNIVTLEKIMYKMVCRTCLII